MSPRSPAEGTTPLPPAGSRGTLIRGDGGRWPVRVIECQDATIMLVALLGLDDRSWAPAPERVALEAITHWGLIRLEGEATVTTADVIRLRACRVTDVLQRRGLARVAVSRPVLLVAGAAEHAIGTYTIDLSGNGMSLAGPDNLRLASHVGFSLRFDPEQPAIEGRGRVARIDAGQPSISFRDISERDRERLIHFIFEHQRLARGLTRDVRP
jgi:hypothetical protein